MAKKRPTAKRPRSIRKVVPKSKAPVHFLVEALYDKKGLTGDDKARTRILKMFEPLTLTEAKRFQKSHEFIGNLFQYVAYDRVAKTSKVYGKMSPWLETGGIVQLSRVISPSLALYRTLCLFQGAAVVHSPDNDKSPFGIYLRHITTGLVVKIGEWKGGFRFYAEADSPKECAKPFLRDLPRLMDVLLSENCPHPYSGLVAGLVA